MNGATPKSGAQVNLTLTVVPEADGYNHAVGQHTAPHIGSLNPTAGTTGADGNLRFYFISPGAGGVHTITASCVGCSNQATGTIKVSSCRVRNLTPIADLSALAGETPEQTLLTQQLENGMDGYSLLTPATQAAEQCFAGKVAAVLGPATTSGYKVTSTIRTFAYQKHLREVWDKFWDLKSRLSDPTIKQSCQTLIAKVEGEMGFRLTQNPKNEDDKCNATLGRAHCIRYEPATGDPKHVAKTAFDIPPMTVKKFGIVLWSKRIFHRSKSTVQTEANACGLNWGGTFASPDKIHFLLK